jgi:hypothetical protein
VHTSAVTAVHGGVRLVARAVGVVIDVALSAVEKKRSGSTSDPDRSPSSPNSPPAHRAAARTTAVP